MKKYIYTAVLLLGAGLPAFASSDNLPAPKKKLKVNPSRSAAQEVLSANKKLKSFSEQMNKKIRDPEKMGAELFKAVAANNAVRVKELIEFGANVNYVQKGTSVLGLALNNCAQNKGLLSLNVLLNATNLKYNGVTVSCCVNVLIEEDQPALLDKVLTKLPVPADTSCKQALAPLFVALNRAQWQAASVLIKHGASLKQVAPPEGYSPLHVFLLTLRRDGIRIDDSAWEVLNLMLEEEPALLIKGTVKGQVSPVMMASAYGYYDLIVDWSQRIKKANIDKNAFINAMDQNNENALFYALSQRNSNTILTLVDMGADVNAPNRHGVTPVNAAKQIGMWVEAEYMEKHSR